VSLKSILDALIYISWAGMTIGFIMTVNYSMFAWYIITMTISVIFFILLISRIYLDFKDNSLEIRKLPWWVNTGYFMMFLGILLYLYPELGIVATLTGLIIILCAIYYKEHRNYEKMDNGAEGEI